MFDENNFLQHISPSPNGRLMMIPKLSLRHSERARRRLAYRNEHILHKRKSSLSGDTVISFFRPDSPYVVYSHDEWWSDRWNALNSGIEFDFDRDFFSQFKALQLRVPRPPLVNNNAENSPYCNFADNNKNCHMTTSGNDLEDCYYCFLLVNCKDCVDCLWCTDSELLFECIDCRKSYNLRYSQNCDNCSDSLFLKDCRGVRNSYMCHGLSNVEYYAYNKPVSHAEFRRLVAFLDGSYDRYQQVLQQYGHLPLKPSVIIASENVTGNHIFNSKNIFEGHDVYESEDCAYVHDGIKGRDSMEVCFFDGIELCYESTSLRGYGYRFTTYCRASSNLFYCDNCHSCKDLFGCVGLRNKQHCIFNKQYSADDYEDLMERIILRMIDTDEWGEFFPINNSLFPYEDTLANDYYPILSASTAQTATNNTPSKIPDNITNTTSDICKQILICETTGKPYKVILPEYKYYSRMQIPIPRRAPYQRLKDRIAKRPS